MKKPDITEGEWKFVVDENSKRVQLISSTGDQVMDFVRYGFQGAQPRFFTEGIMIEAEERAVVVEDREHHKSWYKEVDHPVADLIEAVPHMVRALILVDRDLRDFEYSLLSNKAMGKVSEALKKAGVEL